MSSPLLTLPTELLIAVLRNLSCVDLFRCEQVCKTLRDLIKSSSDVQYGIKLEEENYDDVPSSVGIPEKLNMLNKAYDAWNKQQSRFISNIEVKHHVSGIYDLAGGVYLLGEVTKHVMYWIPLPEHEGDEPEWKSFKIPESIIDIGLGIDEHDLCAVVTISHVPDTEPQMHDIALYFYQLSTGEPHPNALQHRILVHRTDTASRPAIGIEIVGENLVLILTHHQARAHPDDRVYIYEWKTGKVKMSLVAPYRTYAGPLFLTEHLVCLPNSQTGMLEIWNIPKAASDPSPSSPCCNLALPTLAPGRIYSSISSRGEPNPVGDSSPAGSRFRKRSYEANAEHAIMIFNVTVDPSQNPFGIALGHSYTFFVHRKSVLNAFEEAEVRRKSMRAPLEPGPLVGSFIPPRRSPFPVTSPDNDIDISFPNAVPSTITVPWAEWGPPVTRWLEAERFPTRWITTTAGQRAILTNLPATGGTNMLVFDFNPWHIKKSAYEIRQKRIEMQKAAAEGERGRKEDKGKSVDRVRSGSGSGSVGGGYFEPVSPPEVHQSALPNPLATISSPQPTAAPQAASETTYAGPSSSATLTQEVAGPSSEASSFAQAQPQNGDPFQAPTVSIPGMWAEDDDMDTEDGEWVGFAVEQNMDENDDSDDPFGILGENDDEDEEDAQAAGALTMANLANLPPGFVNMLLAHPNGLALAQQILDLQEQATADAQNTNAGGLGYLGEVVGEGSESMPGGWSESNEGMDAMQDEEDGDEEGHTGLRTCVVFQKTQVDKFGRSFESPVVSQLPFVQYMSWIEEKYEGVLMDEERLLGISTEERDIEKVDVLYLG